MEKHLKTLEKKLPHKQLYVFLFLMKLYSNFFLYSKFGHSVWPPSPVPLLQLLGSCKFLAVTIPVCASGPSVFP